MQMALIVEHDPSLRELQRTLLERNGYVTICTDQGWDALEMAQRYRPHLVILNDVLPRLPGGCVSASIKNDPFLAETIVVLVGAVDRIDDQNYIHSTGADAVLRIPYLPRDLVRLVTAFAPAQPMPIQRVLP
jgi:DNA-binding response OmpR family regulator